MVGMVLIVFHSLRKNNTMIHKEGITIDYTKNKSLGSKCELSCKIQFNSPILNYPLIVYFTSQSGSILWSTTILTSNTWCELPSSRNLDIRIIDNQGELILNNIWEDNINSDICELKFIEWCKFFISQENKKPKGIVIGSHNGLTGEWVNANNKNLIGSTLLIEPNEKPFQQLISNYQNDFKFSFKNILVSETGGYMDFYTNENEDSESSSIIMSNVNKYHENIITKQLYSRTLNDLITEFSPDWIHLDVEGLDAKLLLSTSDEVIKKLKFIIWEDIFLNDYEKTLLKDKLTYNGFSVIVGNEYNTFAIKN
jgi:FkbM family methyltransferase